MPGIEVNPEEEIVREAERIQKMFEREKWQDDNHDYVPEVFGFFVCREHFGVISPRASMFLLISLNVILLRMLILPS